MRLASARKTHFSESDARRMVVANLGDLLERCCDVDTPMRKSAHLIIVFQLWER